jgi:hypothetical protein
MSTTIDLDEALCQSPNEHGFVFRRAAASLASVFPASDTIRVDLAPGDEATYAAATGHLTIEVLKGTVTIRCGEEEHRIASTDRYASMFGLCAPLVACAETESKLLIIVHRSETALAAEASRRAVQDAAERRLSSIQERSYRLRDRRSQPRYDDYCQARENSN